MSQGKRELDSPSHETPLKRRKRASSREPAEQVQEAASEPETPAQPSKNLLRYAAGRVIPAGKAFQRRILHLELLLAPIDASDPLAGVERQLDDVLLTYLPQAQGILMGWQDPRFTEPAARILDDFPFSLVQIQVDSLLWRPRQGDDLEGTVKLMGPSHIGLLILGTFNASIPRHLIPPDWVFEEDLDENQGFWHDGQGTALTIGQEVRFSTHAIKKGSHMLSVEGSLLGQVFEPKYMDTGNDAQSTSTKRKKHYGESVDEKAARKAAKQAKRQHKEAKARKKAQMA